MVKAKYLKDPDLRRNHDFDLRKHLHVKLFTRTKNDLRAIAYRMDLSLQEIFEFLANAIIAEDPYLIKILNKYKIDKENKKIMKASKSDEEDIFEALSRENPFGEE
jgi:hypothetical protein